jgi:hypothetical protein
VIAVRRAEAHDVPWLVDELRAFADRYGTKKSLCPDDPTEAQTIVLQMVEDHVFFIAEHNSERVGCVAGYLVGHPFNPSIRLLAETFWLVTQVPLSGFAAVALLDAFVAFGRDHADWITFGTVEGVTHAAARHFLRRGFRLHERSYLLEVN